MRIIAGVLRGRRLVPPHGRETTRPITDKVKETLFNKLASHGIFPGPSDASNEAATSGSSTLPSGPGMAGPCVADVFAGTGSLGLEALSRGAGHCTFVEGARSARRGLEQNLAALGLTDRATILETDGLAGAWRYAAADGSLRVIFLDPPYALMRDPRTREQLEVLLALAAAKLEPAGVIVLRGPAEDEATPASVAAPAGGHAARADLLDGPITNTFKHMALHYYQKPPAEEG